MEAKICKSIQSIKSIFFIRRLLNILHKKRMLEVAKYNKKIQKILDISLDDYKEYSYNFTPIEIEIKPAEVKGKFINISNKEEEKYYHIYFNDSFEEIKKKYELNGNDQVTKIKIIV